MLMKELMKFKKRNISCSSRSIFFLIQSNHNVPYTSLISLFISHAKEKTDVVLSIALNIISSLRLNLFQAHSFKQ